jgi:hypothetical protein
MEKNFIFLLLIFVDKLNKYFINQYKLNIINKLKIKSNKKIKYIINFIKYLIIFNINNNF